MDGNDIYRARSKIGRDRGLGRHLTREEMAEELRLSRGPEAIRDLERGHMRISGPISVAVEALISGFRPQRLEPDQW